MFDNIEQLTAITGEKRKRMNKYIKDGKVAVIVSPEFGAGWSTWNDQYAMFLAMDSGLVALKLQNASEKEVKAYINKTLGEDSDVYTGGWDDAVIEWLDPEDELMISEYDGYETIL